MSILLGYADDREICIDENLRFRHMLVGIKNNAFIEKMIKDDITSQESLVFLDTKMDSIDNILAGCGNQKNNISVLNLEDADSLFSINMFGIYSKDENDIVWEKSNICDTIVSLFNKYFIKLSYVQEDILRNAIFAIMETSDETNFSNISLMLASGEYRDKAIACLDDIPKLKEFWINYCSKIETDAKYYQNTIGLIVDYLKELENDEVFSKLFCGKRKELSLFEIVKNRSVLLVNLGEEKVKSKIYNFIGSFIVSKLYFIKAFDMRLRYEHRKPFYIYLKNYSYFQSDKALASILSEARIYNVGLIINFDQVKCLRLESFLKNPAIYNCATVVISSDFAEELNYDEFKIFNSDFTKEQMDNFISDKSSLCARVIVDGKKIRIFSAFD